MLSHRPLSVPLPDRRTLTDSVYDSVRELVTDEHIAPGNRISIEDLARRLLVSATPVREALARLESEHLVIKEPLKGYLAAPPLTAAGIEQLYDVRELVEPAAAALACRWLDESDLAELEATLRTMRQAPTGASYPEYRLYSQADARFHGILAERSGNPFLADVIRRLRIHPQTSRLYFRLKRVPGHQGTAEHEHILATLRSRDSEAVRSEMAAHIRRSRERIRAIQSGGNQEGP